MTDWQARAQHLADELTAAGKLRSPRWQQAIAQVPRHKLVPSYYTYTEHGWQVADTSSPQGQQQWLALVYSNKALFVLPDGLSSTSMPGLMTRMLEALDVHDGHRVLEIGTGTGYNAALLCHRLGDDQVFSVDIDAELIELARTADVPHFWPTICAPIVMRSAWWRCSCGVGTPSRSRTCCWSGLILGSKVWTSWPSCRSSWRVRSAKISRMRSVEGAGQARSSG